MQEALQFTLACLKNTHNLRTLVLKGPEKHVNPSLTPKMEKLLCNIFNIMQAKKVDRLKFITDVGLLNCSPHLLKLDNYRKTLKEVTLAWSNSKPPLMNEVIDLNKHLSLAHIWDLRRLELYIPIDLKTLNVIMESVREPAALKSLGLIIKDETIENRELGGLVKLVKEARVLEKLVLKFIRWPDIFKELMIGMNCPLRWLELQVEVKYEHNLDDLGNFLEGLRHLKTLNLSVARSFLQVESFEKNIIGLYEKVAKLKSLKNLGFRLGLGEAQNPEILRSMGRCLEGLEDLEELCIDQAELYFTYQEDYLWQILKNKAGKLKRLEVKVQEKEKKTNSRREEQMTRFVMLLGQMKELEILSISGLWLNSEEAFGRFGEAILGLRRIRDVSLKEMETPMVSGGSVLRFIRKMLGKRRFESLVYDESWSTNPKERYRDCEKIDMMELVRDNAELKAVTIPSYMRNNMSFGPFINMFKWY